MASDGAGTLGFKAREVLSVPTLPPLSFGFSGGDAAPSQAVSGITSTTIFASPFAVGAGASSDASIRADTRGGSTGSQAASPGSVATPGSGAAGGLDLGLGSLSLWEWVMIGAVAIALTLAVTS